ncbi:MAG: hypothetical protein U5K74_00335 [Gemmatimonadaceae bacterium]|nr:hypothetical protein [Gemmatimonadaceae bacterium]
MRAEFALRLPHLRRAAVALALSVVVADGAAAQADGLHVRTGNREAVVPWVTSNGARFLPLTSLARALRRHRVQATARGVTLDACGVLSRFVVGQRTVDLGSAGVEQLAVAVRRVAASVEH